MNATDRLCCLATLLATTGCSASPVDSQPGASGSGGTASVVQPDLAHTFPTLDVDPGQEIPRICQSWTVGNDSPIAVNRIVAHNPGSVHHSNWIWVPESQYPGADGTWNCADRGFDQVLAAGLGGGVFFAQSTQSLTDTQAFPPGVAFEMPAHVKIIGDVHLLNPNPEVVHTQVSFDIFTIEPSSVTVPVQPMAFTNMALDIPKLQKTSAGMQCATQADFDVYYVLPHYHSLGTGMNVTVIGGPSDGASVFDASPGIGEPWGKTYVPPFSVRGATALRLTCSYDNNRSTAVAYGNGDQEMCVVLLYTSGQKAGGQANLNLTATDVNGVHVTDGLCLAI